MTPTCGLKIERRTPSKSEQEYDLHHVYMYMYDSEAVKLVKLKSCTMIEIERRLQVSRSALAL